MDWIFYLAAPLLFFSGFPQTLKLLKTKKSDDISALTYFCTWLGVFISFANSLQNGNLSLSVSNGFSMVTLTTNLFLILKYRNYAENS